MNYLIKTQIKRFSNASITTTDIIHHKTCLKTTNKQFDLSKLVIFSDFDYTITNKYELSKFEKNTDNPQVLNNIYTSFSLIENSGKISERYKLENKKLFDKHNPIDENPFLEVEYKKENSKIWLRANKQLLLEEKLTNKCLDNVVKYANKDLIRFRKGFDRFLDFIDKHNIPFYVISAGIQDSIDAMMNYYFKNQIESLKSKDLYTSIGNKFIFNDKGQHIGFEEEEVYVFNKGEVIKNKMKHTDKNQFIMIGDHLWDVFALDSFEGQKVTFGFGNFNKNYLEHPNYTTFIDNFDISIVNDGSFDSIVDIIEKHSINNI